MRQSKRASLALTIPAALGVALAVFFPWPQDHGSAVLVSSNQKQALLHGVRRAAESFETISPDLTDVRTMGAASYVPGRLVVKFAGGLSARAMQVASSGVAASRVVQRRYADFVEIEIPRDADPVDAAAKMASRSDVVYAEPDPIVHAAFRPNDPLYEYQWNLHKLDMERAWAINRGSKSSIIVAVIDTGIAYTDRGAFALAPELAGSPFVPGYDFIWQDDLPVDMDGHGTHVAGTIAQTTNNEVGVAGIAFNVSLMPIKVIATDWDRFYRAPNPFGSGSDLAQAIRFATDNGARIINLSLGSLAPSTPVLDALRYAVGRGVFVAIAAGNEATSRNPVVYPAAYAKQIDGVMAVGALGYDLKRAYYSSFHDYVEIAAPGGDTRVDLNHDGYPDGVLQQTLDLPYQTAGIFNRFTYRFLQGTSMAAPHVAGFAALLMDQGVRSPAAVEAAIKKFATDLGPAGPDPHTGHGMLNPRATLRGLGLLR
jgi:serine protease